MDNTLTAKLLLAPLICKGFISGMDDCDYEIYLREVVNASAYFKGKSDGAEYTAPPEESHFYVFLRDGAACAYREYIAVAQLRSKGLGCCPTSRFAKIRKQGPVYTACQRTKGE